MVLVGALRIKNEARWIDRVIGSIMPYCDRVVVLDDHSTDDTAQICRGLGCQVVLNPFEGLNETRDKNYLIGQCGNPDWILMIDGDEVIAGSDGAKLRKLCEQDMLAWTFQILYLWDHEDQIRVDGVYRQFRRTSLFKFWPGQSFRVTGNGGGFHCGSMPEQIQRSSCSDAEVRLIHYGYLDRADRLRKYEWYNRQTPVPEGEDGYRHMVIGDIPELPANSRTRFAGPLTLEPLCL